jgi:hypothetical protein
MTTTDALFAAERVKWRKSWMLVTAVLAPLCQTGFFAIFFWFSEDRLRMFKPGLRFWVELNFATWNLVVLPVVAGLICELSWEQEREARAWNLLLVQPVPQRAHYLVKGLGHFVLVLISHLLFLLVLVLLGLLLKSRPDPLLIMGSLPVALLARFLGWSVLASLSLVAFHTWLSMRIPGIWIALATALAGSWLAQRLVGFPALGLVLPWGLAAHMSIIFERWRVLPWAQVPLSLLLAMVLSALGTLDFSRHRESRS